MKAVYWDASAVVSILVRDRFTGQAQRALRRKDVHLLSSLAMAEVDAVIARMAREKHITARQAGSAADTIREGVWQLVWSHPASADLARLSREHPLRGADLWHLANALGLRDELSDVVMLSFDERLASAARAEGLGV